MISTHALPSSLGRRRNRGFTIGVVLGLALPLTVLLVFSLVPRDGNAENDTISPEIRAQRSALTAFDQALSPLVDTGAATVVYGMRPGIDDIYNQSLDDDVLASMAEGWVETTGTLGDDFAAIDIPDFLAETADLYRQAFDAYHDTARALLAAATSTGTERSQHISEAAEHGSRADQLYDTAKAQHDEHRQRLGM